MYLVLLLLNFINLFSATEARFINNNICKEKDNINSCIDVYGCGWCNTTNNSFINNQHCSEISVCPESNLENCEINQDYYYRFNCFLINIFLIFIIIGGFCLFNLCIIGMVLSLYPTTDVNRKTKYIITIYSVLILTLGILSLLFNELLFLNVSFYLTLILLFIVILNGFQRYKISKRQHNYTLINDHEPLPAYK